MAFTTAIRILLLLFMLLARPAAAAPFGEPWTLWQSGGVPATTETIDHSRWQALLDHYVAAAPDGINRVDYPALARHGRPSLEAYLDYLGGLDPRLYTNAEQKAFWINLYNALTVRVVLGHPGHDSIRSMGRGLFSRGPWDDVVFQLAGQDLTLNDIEHRILRPLWRDHRIHFAVNCASLGCPNLSTRAFTAANTEQLLAAAERAYINHPRGVQMGARLQLSSIFDWYLHDFAQGRQALLSYLASHHRSGQTLAGFDGDITYHYDWSLNGPVIQ